MKKGREIGLVVGEEVVTDVIGLIRKTKGENEVNVRINKKMVHVKSNKSRRI